MSEIKKVNHKLSKEDKERYEEQEKIIRDAKAPAKTDILKHIKFKNDLDKQIFNLLPLSDAQKEELVLHCEFDKTVDEITDSQWDGRLSPTIEKGINADIEQPAGCSGGHCVIPKKK